MKKLSFIIMIAYCGLNEVNAQWNTNGTHIYNTNTGNVGIGNSSPTTMLHVQKNMTEPTITVQNLGGSGGATYTMIDNASGADWKFKATLSGGFKIRDHANSLDVIVIEPNSTTNAIYINSAGSVGIGTATPESSAAVDISSADKGFLPPRMTHTEMLSIINPAEGLIVFCTDCSSDGTGKINMFNAGSWFTLNMSPCPDPPSAPLSGTHTPSPDQITWNWNSVEGAMGYKWNITNDISTAQDMGNALSKSETNLNPSMTYTRYVWSYHSCGHSEATLMISTTLAWVCGYSLTINHVAGTVAPITKTTNYGTVTNIPGENSKCWITSNLGSDHQATSLSDSTEASAGWYWRFNRTQGYKHSGLTSTPNWTIITINENSNWIIANDPCNIELGGGWHVPTHTEWNNAVTIGNWATGIEAWNSDLKLHEAGYLWGGLVNRGFGGYYHSGTQTSNTWEYFLTFTSTGLLVWHDWSKSTGFSVRCIKD